VIWKNFFILSWAQHGSGGIFCKMAVALCLTSANYIQINWFWFQVLSQVFTMHNSYSDIHSGCTFLSKCLNQIKWGKSEVGSSADYIKSLQPAYCGCCPIYKPARQSRGQVPGWGDVMLSCTSGGASSGFRAYTWGSRHSWCWRRAKILQCKSESLHRPSDVTCSRLQQSWD